ncbi:sigma-70 family RNA polymerase sigma factor [Nocardia mikamii]|uniref:sigma-70 family RNA polymerase sigma factor n=1 Tax=Nocardia mikamii TaxID=508464 RepID=UPI001430387C|nr:sigma-70 family RNA polymerase sigma factor [Nocardia mikamii]
MSTATAPPESESPPGPLPEATGLAHFQCARPRLFGIAYRMLGRAADAEDVVQDVWLRWQRTDRAQVRDGLAFLVTVTTRVSLNSVGSARARREIPVDNWLPGQVPVAEDPCSVSERSAVLSDAVALLLQRLSPTERAVFVLREAFDYPFRDIAGQLGISEANARQLARRARAHLTEPRPATVSRTAHDRLLTAFLAAARDGAVMPLERILAEDISAPAGRDGTTGPAGERRSRPLPGVTNSTGPGSLLTEARGKAIP